MTTPSPRVFISYAQGDAAHSQWIAELAARLRADGLDAIIDQGDPRPLTTWQNWVDNEFRRADRILLACTRAYRLFYEGGGPRDVGRGVCWEANLIRQELSDNKFVNPRFVPILPTGGGEGDIPPALRGFVRFKPDEEYAKLLAFLRRPPVVDETNTSDSPVAGVIPNPYPGLAAFTERQAGAFFGRDEDIRRVVDRLIDQRQVCLVGRSGTGKSSLVAAGVLPALRKRVSGAMGYLRFTPQDDPFARFADALDRLMPEERLRGPKARVARLAEELRAQPAKALSSHLSALAPLLIFADQFEELFTQTSEAGRQDFAAVWGALLDVEGVYLALTLRSEFYASLADWLGAARLGPSHMPLDPITDDARYRQLIARPATDCGIPIDDALVSELATTARGMAGALPLLALTLQRLFESRDPVLGITRAAWQTIGGLAESVKCATAPVDEAIDADPALPGACDTLFAALTSSVDGIPTRRSARVAGLRGDDNLAYLVDALRTQGVLTDTEDGHVEIAHETLFLHWPRLADWCVRHAIFLARRREVEQAASDWRSSGNRLLMWGWERQKPAIEALCALGGLEAQHDPEFTDPGIHAWRALQGRLDEALRSFLRPEPLALLEELRQDDTSPVRREDIGRRLNSLPDPRKGVGLDARGVPDIAWETVDVPEGGAVVTLETEPPQQFRISRPFRIARYPVTWRQYKAFVAADDGYRNPEWWEGLEHEEQPGPRQWDFANHPAIKVSWHDAMAFCRWLTGRLNLEGEVVRLPNEWEWQWVAQAGAAGLRFPWGPDWRDLGANSAESGIGRTTAVGLFPAGRVKENEVYDMAGNVWEWCLNQYYDPAGREDVESRVLRGGAWYYGPDDCRAAFRDYDTPDYRDNDIGFRVCRGSPIDPRDAASLGAESPSR
ncbi:MAG: SUMF1/EgtB/PvdO family nonheme iron enzyme [Zoogloea sp.]|nr:SUMF1/EgtB/PvdO family nonheme iron enzyme [Zoogloea sp.]